MPGQYYIYVPFLSLGDLETGITTWRRNAHAMSEVKAMFDGISAQIEVAKSKANLGELADAKIRLENFISDKTPNKHGGYGLDVRKVPIVLKHDNFETKPLEILWGQNFAEYTLYIIGHCAMGSNHIFNRSPKTIEAESLTAATLVERLIADGLPKNAFNLKLLACHGADAYGENESFMAQLQKKLSAYLTRATLRGYTAPVLISKFYQDEASKKASLPIANIKDPIIPAKGPLSHTSKNIAWGKKCACCDRIGVVMCPVCSEVYCSVTHRQMDFTKHQTTCAGFIPLN